MTDKQIQEYIEKNLHHEDGTPMVDVQTFYEGAKWARNQMNSSNDIHNVSGISTDLEKDLFVLINKYAKAGLSKPHTVARLEWVLGSVKKS